MFTSNDKDLLDLSPAPQATDMGELSQITQAEAEANGDAAIPVPHSRAHELPEIQDIGLRIATDVHVAGMNAALRRPVKLEAVPIPLLTKAGYVPSWKPVWTKVRTVGLTFPAGMEFLPIKQESEEAELKRLEPPKSAEADDPSKPAAKKPTRIKPPADALSLEDRLFYVLQPPLESWLKGQELIMPFEPFPYQYEGIAWIFAQKAALLADEMGLGKTMQTITAIRLLLRSGQVRRILLVCPKPLIPNWQREFKMWAEEIPVTTLEGDGARRAMLWRMPGAQVLLCNYELMVRDYQTMLKELAEDGSPKQTDGLGRRLDERSLTITREAEPQERNPRERNTLERNTDQGVLMISRSLELPKFDLVVLDEAQRIKNRDSVTSSTARAIPRLRSLALTGTPIENRPEEMGVIFEFMGVVPPNGAPDIRQLTQLSREYVLRRTKDLVMKDMPPRLDRDAVIELAPAQRQAYETAEKDGVIQLNEMGDSITVQHVFELVMRLKQLTNFDPLTNESSKLDRLLADMEEISASGGKAILFSQWTKTIDWIKERVQPFGPLIYHGGIPHKHREPILQQFKEDPSKHIILMSYATGAVGLNLQFAGYVFLYDRWWNPAVEDQAINRAHRIGCKSQVIVSKFICKDTIEEKIDKVLAQKRALFAQVLGEGDNENASLSMSASEIFGLFNLKARSAKGVKKIAPKPPTQADAA